MTRRFFAVLCVLVLSLSGLLLHRSIQPSASTVRSPNGGVVFRSSSAEIGQWIVSEPVEAVTTTAVRDLLDYVPSDNPRLVREVNPRMSWNSNPLIRLQGQIDPLLEKQANAGAATDAAFQTPILNKDGQGFSNVNPPDTTGDVGPNHFIQIINANDGSSVVIYDKNLNIVKNPFLLGSLGSGNCANGAGDPIVLYDRLADRWFLSEFTAEGIDELCLYVSKTADPTGEYHHYAFKAPTFPDYPKYGVWPDAYYAGTNETGAATMYAFDRNKMLAGQPATFQRLTTEQLSGFGFQAIVPSDLDGATAPPENAPNYFMRHRDTESHGAGTCPNAGAGDCLEIFEFRVDWTTPSNSTVSQPISIPIAEIDSDLCGLSSFQCIQQKDGTTPLDPLREVIMPRLQYRNFGTHETLVGNLTTDVNGNDRAGVRWFELRKTGNGNWALHQEGTYAPNDSHSRWMGSAAMDKTGNIAVAYNVSSSSMYPSLRYAGRLASDAAGTLPQGEVTIIAGGGANGSERYGDYSQMGVDPADDCTFWFTGEYSPSEEWSTRIVTFKFSACGTPTNLTPRVWIPIVIR